MKTLTTLLLLIIAFAVNNSTAQVTTETDTTQVTEQADSMTIAKPYVEPLKNNDFNVYNNNSGNYKSLLIASYVAGGVGGYMLGYYLAGALRSPSAKNSPALMAGGIGFIGLGIALGLLADNQKKEALSNKALSFINKYQPGLCYGRNIYGNNSLTVGLRVPIR